MHTANRIKDGFFEIIQDAQTFRIELYKDGTCIREIEENKMLTLDELRARLIHERTNYFMNTQ